jgi:hypothetical protein
MTAKATRLICPKENGVGRVFQSSLLSIQAVRSLFFLREFNKTGFPTCAMTLCLCLRLPLSFNAIRRNFEMRFVDFIKDLALSPS